MQIEQKIIKYPENLPLKDLVIKSGKSIRHLAAELEISREVLSRTINGAYLGKNIVPALLVALGEKLDYIKG